MRPQHTIWLWLDLSRLECIFFLFFSLASWRDLCRVFLFVELSMNCMLVLLSLYFSIHPSMHTSSVTTWYRSSVYHRKHPPFTRALIFRGSKLITERNKLKPWQPWLHARHNHCAGNSCNLIAAYDSCPGTMSNIVFPIHKTSYLLGKKGGIWHKLISPVKTSSLRFNWKYTKSSVFFHLSCSS